MKKLLYSLFFVLATSMMTYSQFFVGGTLGFGTSGGSIETNDTETDKSSSLNLSLEPQAGFFISEDVSLGAYLSLGFSHFNNHGDPETIHTSTSFGISPFIRYYAIRINKFSIYGQARIIASISNSKDQTGDVSVDGPANTTLGLSVYPGMAYDISDKIQLMAGINVFSLSLTHNIEKDGDIRDKTTSFGFGANLNNIVTSGQISVGAIFRF